MALPPPGEADLISVMAAPGPPALAWAGSEAPQVWRMAMITNILDPVDGSSQADKAIMFAADLARRYDAKMTLYHVTTDVRRSAVPPGLKSHVLSGHLPVDATFAGVSRQIRDLSAEKAREHGMSAPETVSEVGDPAAAINDFAKYRHVDLIVSGSSGLSDSQGFLRVSVSHTVAHLAPAPVSQFIGAGPPDMPRD